MFSDSIKNFTFYIFALPFLNLLIFTFSITTLSCPTNFPIQGCICKPLNDSKLTNHFEVTCSQVTGQDRLFQILETFDNHPNRNDSSTNVEETIIHINLILERCRFNAFNMVKAPYHRHIAINELRLIFPSIMLIGENLFKTIATELKTLIVMDRIYPSSLQNGNMEALLRAISMLKGLNQLEMMLPHMMELNMSMFNELSNLDHLVLLAPNLHTVHSFHQDNMLNVTTLMLTTKLPYILRDGINYKQLQVLSYSTNELSTLNPNVFAGALNLKSLILQDTSLETLPSTNIFAMMPALEELHLTHNKIHTLSPFCPWPNPGKKDSDNDDEVLYPINTDDDSNKLVVSKLKQIDLRSNKLKDKTLGPELFENCVALRKIGLDANELSHLPSNLFDSVAEQINTLQLAHNKFDDIPISITSKLKNLTHLYLQNNNIGHFPQHAFTDNTQLKVLNLGFNKLTQLNFTRGDMYHNTLQYLILKNNELTSFPYDSLAEFTQLESVDISGNRITGIEGLLDFLLSSSLSIQIRLNDNPIICDCNVYDFLTWYYYESNELDGEETFTLEASCSNPTFGISNSRLPSHRLLVQLDRMCHNRQNVTTNVSTMKPGMKPMENTQPIIAFETFALKKQDSGLKRAHDILKILAISASAIILLTLIWILGSRVGSPKGIQMKSWISTQTSNLRNQGKRRINKVWNSTQTSDTTRLSTHFHEQELTVKSNNKDNL